MLSDDEVAELFGDDAAATEPRKSAPQRGGRPPRRPPKARARQVDLWDIGLDDLDDVVPESSPSDPVSSLCSRIAFYFEQSARILVDEVRAEIEGLIDPFQNASTLVQSVIDDISNAVKRELAILKRLRLPREKLRDDQFEAFEPAFEKLFREASQYANRLGAPALRRCSQEASQLAQAIQSGLEPFVAILNSEISDAKAAMQRAPGRVQGNELPRRLWELEGQAREQELVAKALKSQLLLVNELRKELQTPFFEEGTKSGIAESIDLLREAVKKRNRRVAMECRSCLGELQRHRMSIGKMRSELLNSGLPVLPMTALRREPVAHVKDRKSEDWRFSQLRTILDSIHEEQRQDLENATMFLEALKMEEITHQRGTMRRRDNTSVHPVQQSWTV
jgi:hypothetical protein